MNKCIFRSILVGVVLLGAIPVLAQGGPDRRGPHGGGPADGGEPPIERMLERLELSEDQQVEIDGLLSNARESAHVKMQQLREHRQEMQRLLEADDVDESAYRQAAQEAGQLTADMALERARTHKLVKAQLTPEQLAQADEMRERRQGARRDGKRGRGGPQRGDRPGRGKRDFKE